MTLREGIKRIWSWSIHVVISCTWKITRGHKYSIHSMNFTRPHYCTKSWFWSGETERLFFFHLSAKQSLGCTFPPPLLSSLYLWNIHSHALYKQMWKCESSHLSITAPQHWQLFTYWLKYGCFHSDYELYQLGLEALGPQQIFWYMLKNKKHLQSSRTASWED